ncbi:hypothetical protein [Mesorhizobium huakuii]|uniref:Secreted protein n=1 Tax=Mesorhizobium huakuii TaxID=28104 RepID=A0ABZ0VZ20_9HYPH|nr:hypothetical protein [Mesorhizobium huakuii]WQC01500.1 hypothetical protein U0R22_005719 [Mesorhizobium huakuii]
MTSAVSATTMTSAVVAIVRLVEPLAASNGLTAGTFFWRGQKHAPKEKQNDASEYQQQDCEMHPSGRVHLNSPLFPRPGRQFDSTKRM